MSLCSPGINTAGAVPRGGRGGGRQRKGGKGRGRSCRASMTTLGIVFKALLFREVFSSQQNASPHLHIPPPDVNN